MSRHVIPSLRLVVLGLAAAVLHAPIARDAGAQSWPDRPITLINPAQAGGSNEVIKRIVFDRVAEALGKPIVMESRAGASGAIAAGITSRAAPDGYTWMLGTSSALTAGPATQKGVGYDPLRDFTALSTLVEIPLVLVVTKSVQATNVRELVESMRREPDRYNYGSWGLGSVNFLVFEQFKRLTGTNAVHIPFKGGTPLVQALVAGEIQVAFFELSTLRPHLASGAVRILGVVNAERVAFLPEVPTMLEQGISLTKGGVLMLVGPPALPDPIADRINAEVSRTLADPDVRRKLNEFDVVVVGGTREQATNRIATDFARWRKVVEDIGFQPQ